MTLLVYILIALFWSDPGLVETQAATCCVLETTTLGSRMTLNAPCLLNASSFTGSTTVRVGSTTLHCWGSKALRETVWRSTHTLVQCVCPRQETGGRKDLLPVSSQAGASQVTITSSFDVFVTFCAITLLSKVFDTTVYCVKAWPSGGEEIL